MIILNQDFYSNFAGSLKSKDGRLTKDLLLNELSDIVAYDEKSLIDLFNKVGIRTNDNTPDDKLVEKLVDNLPNNDKLQRGIAYMIADNHDLMKIRVVSKKDGTKKPATKETYVAIIDRIYNGMKPIVDDLKRDGEAKKEYKNQIIASVKEKCKTSGITKPQNKKIPKWVWYTAGGLATLGLGYLSYKYIIKPKMAAKMAAGGAVPPAAPAAVPPAPVPSVAVASAAPVAAAPVAAPPAIPIPA